jgi:hypothetical protein
MTPRSRFVITSAFIGFSAAGLAGCGDGSEMGDPADPMTPLETPAAGVSCPTRGALVSPTMPDAVAPPAGSKLFLRVHAEGTQKYACQLSAAGTPAWTFTGPEAKLYDDRCVLIGSHFGGPTWQIEKDGSAVVGKKAGEAPSPAPGAIPWLLLVANSSTGNGALTPVTYVNRIDTVGGLAPSDGCDAGSIGKEIAVPYTSTYLFYKAETKAVTSTGYPY